MSAALLWQNVCLSVFRDHIGWNCSKIISRLVSLARSLIADPNVVGILQGNTRNFARIGMGYGKSGFWRNGAQKLIISEKLRDRTTVTTEDQKEVSYAVSIGAK